MITLPNAVEFLRERLHKAFAHGCHYTAKYPIVIKPAPQEFPWEKVKAELLGGYDLTHNQDGSENKSKVSNMEILLDNTIRELKLVDALRSDNDGSMLSKVILPVVRKMVPNLIAWEIIGVQAMKGPVDQIHTLRVRYADSDIQPLSPLPQEVVDLKAKIKELTDELDQLTLTPKVEKGNKLSIQILKEIVSAKTYKLRAQWNFENAQDEQARHGDVEEMIAVLAQDIGHEIDAELLKDLLDIPGAPTSTFDMGKIDGTPTFVDDVHAALAILINRQANLIAARTRRGSGNWCVISPTALTILQSATASAFARTTETRGAATNVIKFVGTLNNTIRVYVNPYAADDTDVLVGYKGNDIDAGAFYTPYVPVISSGIIIDPTSFSPVVSFMTRSGFFTLDNSSSSLITGIDYFGKVGIDTKNLSFI